MGPHSQVVGRPARRVAFRALGAASRRARAASGPLRAGRWLGLLLGLAAAASCAGHSACEDTPPPSSELRARCKKNGKPEDCVEALDLCRGASQTPSSFCRTLCNDDGAPFISGCSFSGDRCSLAITFEHVECSFCGGL